ncbi:DUF3892 domain-containing protein [Tumebacillus flagellatus]|uniref:DUF3892 domain-containing protein n=1 Tax=Tumebacillus flagellatus TaxID=1157490 RepID=A0A074LG51_9BACL|nr:DUF3892 domain-containing protein [Tumebacillus flagellatus]KEO81201.1 hypothetical protein EL26_21945 [Tumebacillus flagellatus]
MGEKIIAVRKDRNGDIAEVMTHTGRVISIEQAMQEARDGNFDSLDAIDREGNWYIKSSTGDGEPEAGGNLDMLPSFEQAMHEDNLEG